MACSGLGIASSPVSVDSRRSLAETPSRHWHSEHAAGHRQDGQRDPGIEVVDPPAERAASVEFPVPTPPLTATGFRRQGRPGAVRPRKCSGLQSSSELLANIRDLCSD